MPTTTSVRASALAIGIFAALAVFGQAASATENWVSHDSGQPDSFERLITEGHIIHFECPKDWPHVFTQEASFYARRSGDMGNIVGSLIIYVPNPREAGVEDEDYVPYKIACRKTFALSSVSETGSWMSLPLDVVELKTDFYAAVYTYSASDKGVDLALSSKTRNKSHSGVLSPTDGAAGGKGMLARRDGREWLLRVKLGDSLNPSTEVSPEDLTGPGFLLWDDGGAEGFDTMQKCGAMVKFHTDTERKVKRVWAYCKLDGAWYKTTYNAGCWIMNDRWGILNRQDMPYSKFTNIAGWAGVDFPGIAVSGDFYVLVEPVSRPAIQMLIGYDASSENRGSLYGDAGAVQVWECSAPEEASNWMIRVEFE